MVHVAIWNRTDALLAECRLIADATDRLLYRGDQPVGSFSKHALCAPLHPLRIACIPTGALKLVPPLLPGECWRAALPYEVTAFSAHAVELSAVLMTDEPAAQAASARPGRRGGADGRPLLAMYCSPLPLPLWALLRPTAPQTAIGGSSTGACTINRPLINMHDCDLPTYCCAHGRLIVHAPVTRQAK